MISWNWPADFPDNCPPEEAAPADGIYYRIVKDDPPRLEDFVSLYHRDNARAMRVIEERKNTECETKGLSVYADADDAVSVARLFPKIGDKIASVALTPASGKILQTGSRSHHTWWIANNFNPTTIVRSVDYLNR